MLALALNLKSHEKLHQFKITLLNLPQSITLYKYLIFFNVQACIKLFYVPVGVLQKKKIVHSLPSATTFAKKLQA